MMSTPADRSGTGVHKYRVVDTSLVERLFALRDKLGNLHLCHATADVPPLGMRLVGSGPRCGFHLLLGENTGQVYRAVFKTINCSQAVMMAALHS